MHLNDYLVSSRHSLRSPHYLVKYDKDHNSRREPRTPISSTTRRQKKDEIEEHTQALAAPQQVIVDAERAPYAD